MAELIALGVGAYALTALFSPPVQNEPEQPHNAAFVGRFEDIVDDYNHYPVVLTPFPGKQMYNTGFNAQFVHRPLMSYLDAPMRRIREEKAAELIQDQDDFTENFRRNVTINMRNTAQPLYMGFTPEMKSYDRVTGKPLASDFVKTQWLAPNATDSDFANAASMAKVIPRDPDLFTPVSDYFTAYGEAFRYQTK